MSPYNESTAEEKSAMANKQHLDRLRQGVSIWNAWRKKQASGFRPDLNGARLINADLSDADLDGADLRSANLRRAILNGADLRRAHLSGANLNFADLIIAHLSGADLNG